jgi:hypothetical protein
MTTILWNQWCSQRKYGFQGACPDKSAILAESQVVQESLSIPGTGLNLVHHSSGASGYVSTIQLQLAPETILDSLKLVHQGDSF